MAVPRVYRGAGQELATSYDSFEFAATIGYKTFYGVMSEGNVAQLSPNQLFSAALVSESSPRPYPALASSIDTDLDFEFQKPMIMEGFCHLQIAVVEGNTGGVGSMVHAGTYTIYHVDSAGTETQLAQETSTGTGGNIGTGSYRYFPMSFKMEISRKQFKIGDKLRLNVTITSSGTAGTKIVTFLADPLSATVTIGASTFDYSELKLNMPFRIEA